MFQQRSLKLDLFAIALLGVVVFLATSLVTIHRNDAIGELMRPFDSIYLQDLLEYPLDTEIANACGWWGAFAADVLLTLLGIGAYYLVISLAVLDMALLLRRTIDTPLLRAVGWTASLFGVTTLAALLVPDWGSGPMVGSGGYLGMLGSGMLESHFALIGAAILAASIFAGGLLLCTDYLLFRIAAGCVMHATTPILVSARLVTKVNGGRKRQSAVASAGAAKQGGQEKAVAEVETDGPQKVVDDPDEQLSVKVRGKAIAADEETDLLEDDAAAMDGTTTTGTIDGSTEDGADAESTSTGQQGLAPRPHFRVKRKFDKQDREKIMHTLDEASLGGADDYELPGIDLLIEGDELCFDEQVKEVRRKAKILEQTFANFGYDVKVVEIETGPVIAQYEVELESGLRLSKITGLADDLAIALRVPSVRIVAPIPGKNTVGIEVPNEARQVVRLREVIEETNGRSVKMKIPLFLGKDVSGNPLTVDLASLPHLLIAGRTGTGKSVCLNAIISSILMTKKPDEVRLLMIDPKMVELIGYGRLPHLMHPVVTDMRKAEAILAWAVEKMEERYALLARAGVRHITSYNQLGDEELRRRMEPEDEAQWDAIPNHLPFIVIVADEIADLMMTAGKEVEQHIIRLAQKSRAVGIHLILATQKPTVDVITGLIKSNLPARISFQVASRTDSRVVLDEMGAERLLGNGDMLFLWPGTSTLLRGQGTYLTDEEINRIVDSVSTAEQHFVHELVNLKLESDAGAEPGQLKKRDELYEAAVDIVVREGRGSVSLLQRALGIGYGRAARLIDFMAEDGIVGPYAGSQAREVQISLADWEIMQANEHAAPAPRPPELPPTPQRRTNKIKPAAALSIKDVRDDDFADEDFDDESAELEEPCEDGIDDEDLLDEEDEQYSYDEAADSEPEDEWDADGDDEDDEADAEEESKQYEAESA